MNKLLAEYDAYMVFLLIVEASNLLPTLVIVDSTVRLNSFEVSNC